MNRNILKIIALVTMLIDHVGMFFFPNIIWFRVVGRIAFPIYAFFIAQGMHHSKNKQKYMVTLFLFGVLAELPYMFLMNNVFKLNVMFVFIFAGISIMLINKLSANFDFLTFSITVMQFVLIIILSGKGSIEYGLFGIGLILIFYYARNSKVLYITLSSMLIIAESVASGFVSGFTIEGLVQIFSIIALVFIGFYNGEKGKLNLKYFFYLSYPLQFYIIWFFTLII